MGTLYSLEIEALYGSEISKLLPKKTDKMALSRPAHQYPAGV
jgi:hypothetical protein